ncbi:MAG: SPOR domain-containing protein [Muribaculaceae bacterium]|nr:SPOR domain-containing protein [Muribaculaceae bacterium]MDE6702606.1 SPOR domain-containing protein [Muribaculaceae bacterium]
MKSSALLLSVVLLCSGGGVSFAGQPTIADALNTSGSITVSQPQALNDRLTFTHCAVSEADATIDNSTPKVRAGYRVQVFDDNNVRSAKHDAQVRKQQIETRFPEYPVYVTFNSPYWRVKVGDFKNRGEAEAAMAEIRHAFPAMAKSLRIVRDRINH